MPDVLKWLRRTPDRIPVPVPDNSEATRHDVRETRLMDVLGRETEFATGPFTFGSAACRSDDFVKPFYAYWIRRLKLPPMFHRKQWEFVYLAHSLFERGYLKPESRGIGFGVGTEPLADLFCSMGCEIVATDLPAEEAVGTGWIETNQHAATKDGLYAGISSKDEFDRRVTFEPVNMNAIPSHLRDFDFCYSSCSIEHVGSLDLSKQFIFSALDVLRPGGMSIHTTEFNFSSNEQTIDTGPTVLWRQRDFEDVTNRLRDAGHIVAPLDFGTGTHPVDKYIDTPPYIASEPHLRLRLGEFDSTSFGLLVIKAP